MSDRDRAILASLQCPAGGLCDCQHRRTPDFAGCQWCGCTCPWPGPDETDDDPDKCQCCYKSDPPLV